MCAFVSACLSWVEILGLRFTWGRAHPVQALAGPDPETPHATPHSTEGPRSR